MMDIMTAAIGCLVLVLISCLMLVLITSVSMSFGDPDNMDVAGGEEFSLTRYVQTDYEVDNPFPQGNRTLSPNYIDIHPDKLVFYPSRDILQLHDLDEPDNRFLQELHAMQHDQDLKTNSYIILLIRPRTAKIANFLRASIKREGLQLGYELWPSDRVVDFRSADEVNPIDMEKEPQEDEAVAAPEVEPAGQL